MRVQSVYLRSSFLIAWAMYPLAPFILGLLKEWNISIHGDPCHDGQWNLWGQPRAQQSMWNKNRELHSVSLADRLETSLLIKFTCMNYLQPSWNIRNIDRYNAVENTIGLEANWFCFIVNVSSWVSWITSIWTFFSSFVKWGW